MHAVVIVLGDIGRSPRMQYHALSLSEETYISRITLIGYHGEKVLSSITEHKKINIIRIEPINLPSFVRSSSSLIHAVLKGLGILLSILQALISIPEYNFILIQNPPSLPILLANLIISIFSFSFLRTCKRIVFLDWHNLGFTIFSHELKSEKHILVKICRFAEFFLSKFAHVHICVSFAMKDWLKDNFHIQNSKITVLYDRPYHMMIKKVKSNINNDDVVSIEERHRLLSQFEFTDENLFQIQNESLNNISATIQTVFDVNEHKSFKLRPDRAFIIVSSTSWTPDEDFGILLEALKIIEKKLQFISKDNSMNFPSYPLRILVIITGKGPLKSHYEKLFKELEESKVFIYTRCRTIWLQPEDYPLMIACADIGVCLHTSSSGLDLPMKVLDMFGAGIPVCAVEFPTLSELVKHGVNGVIFKTSEDLSDHVIRLLNLRAENGWPQENIAEKELKSVAENNFQKNEKIESFDFVCNTQGDNISFPVKYTVSQELKDLQRQASDISSWTDNWILCVRPIFLSYVKDVKNDGREKKKNGGLIYFFSPPHMIGFAILIAFIYILFCVNSVK